MGTCSPMEPHSSSFSTRNHGVGWAIRSTAELTGDCSTRCLASFTNYLLQRSTVPVGHKRGLPSRDFVVVEASRFHFTITSPTIDLGNLRRVTMSLTDFLLMWRPITSPRSNLPMLVVLLSNEQHTAFCRLLYR
jgi:hypothetical protein